MLKNVLSIKIGGEGCTCNCLESIANGTNQIHAYLNIGTADNARLNIYVDDTLVETITDLEPENCDMVFIPIEHYPTTTGVLSFNYADDSITGDTFYITFPAKQIGEMSLVKIDNNHYEAKFTRQIDLVDLADQVDTIGEDVADLTYYLSAILINSNTSITLTATNKNDETDRVTNTFTANADWSEIVNVTSGRTITITDNR